MLYTHRCTVAIKFNGLLRDNGGQKSSKQSHDASSSLIGDLRFDYTDGRGSTGHISVFCTRCPGAWETSVQDPYHNTRYFSALLCLDPSSY